MATKREERPTQTHNFDDIIFNWGPQIVLISSFVALAHTVDNNQMNHDFKETPVIMLRAFFSLSTPVSLFLLLQRNDSGLLVNGTLTIA